MKPDELQKKAREDCEKCGSTRGHEMHYRAKMHDPPWPGAIPESMLFRCRCCGFERIALL